MAIEFSDLSPDQQDAVRRAEAWYNSRDVRPFAIFGAAGTGKGHPLDTEVPTPDGLRLWGDLQVGDQIYGSSGNPVTVTAIFDRGVLPVYRVTMKHGESVLVDGDHLWATYRSRKQNRIRVVDTEWLSRQVLKGPRGTGYFFKVATNGAVVRSQADLPLHPYVVGSLISNGGLTSNGTMLITPDDDVVAKVSKHVEVRFCPGHECPTYNLVGLNGITRGLGMRVRSRDKRIPRVYLEGSVSQRVDLLHGLFDGDGSARNASRRSVNYHTTSAGLAEDVTELVTSLGGTCSVMKHDRSHHGKSMEYTCMVMLPEEISAFSTARKTQGRSGRVPGSAIVSVVPAGVAEVRCVAVDADDSLYLITRNHIVTHNTTVARHVLAALGTTTQALAPTNRAARILRQRGVDNARTIHSVLFKPQPWCWTENHLVDTRCLQEESKHSHGPRFFKRSDPPEGVKCFTIDEASMVGRRIGDDVGLFRIKTIVIGDPYQLPPVGDDPAYVQADLPGVELSASHRFDSMSSIGRLANTIRTSSGLSAWKRVIPYVGFDAVDGYDLLLAWRNETRWQIINTLRALRGRLADQPQVGDRLISVANTYEVGILNADELIVTADPYPSAHMGAWNVPTDRGVVTAWKAGFRDFEGEKWAAQQSRRKGSDVCALTFSECMTVHKAQGGEWERVLVVDDLSKMNYVMPGELNTWAYTAVTRASQQVDFIKINDFPTGMRLRKLINERAEVSSS